MWALALWAVAEAGAADGVLIRPGGAAPEGVSWEPGAVPGAERAALPLPVEVRQRRVSLDFQDAELRTVLWFLASTGGVNLVLDESVQGRVTVRLKDVTWEDAFLAVLAAEGLSWQGSAAVLTVRGGVRGGG